MANIDSLKDHLSFIDSFIQFLFHSCNLPDSIPGIKAANLAGQSAPTLWSSYLMEEERQHTGDKCLC